MIADAEMIVEGSVTDAAKAKAFLEFRYAEVKDLSKQFLTVVAGVLALSVTFSEKIVNFAEAGTLARVLLMSSWGLCLVAFVLGGAAIFLIYNAGVNAKNTVLYQKLHSYERLTWRAYLCLDAAGVFFVVALLLLVITGILRVLR